MWVKDFQGSFISAVIDISRFPGILVQSLSGDYSSDFRLSGFGAFSASLSISKRFLDRFTARAGFEHYVHRADLKLGGRTESSFADFDFYLLNASFNMHF
jgi:hypothetical protein